MSIGLSITLPVVAFINLDVIVMENLMKTKVIFYS